MQGPVIKSKYRSIRIPEEPLHTHVFSKMSDIENRIAMVDGSTETEVTYRELIKTAQKTGSSLAKLGLHKGDVVIIFSYNTIEYMFMFWGVLCAGGTAAPVNPACETTQLASILKETEAKFIYTTREVLPSCQAALRDVSTIEAVFCSNTNHPDCIPAEHLFEDDLSFWPRLQSTRYRVKEDVAVIMYNTNTTSDTPKGVLLTHHNIVATVIQARQLNLITPTELQSGTSTLSILPFYHVAGLFAVMLFSFVSGNKLVILQNFAPMVFLSVIERYQISYLPLVPMLAMFLAKSHLIHQEALPSLKGLVCSSTPLSKSVKEELMSKLHIPGMQQGYGMIETTLLVLAPHPALGAREGSCGCLVPLTEAKIVDHNTKSSVGPNQYGELWLKGPQIMMGYLKNAKATKLALDRQGYFHTGDIAYYDTEGYFYIEGRIRDLINVGNLQVAPTELENMLLAHPSVDDAGVVGVPGEQGELPRAYIVKKQHCNVTHFELYTFIADQVPSYKHLNGGVFFVEDIPKHNGKILRKKLKAMSLAESVL